MPIVNGVDLANVGKVYRTTDTEAKQIGKVFAYDGTNNELVYTAELALPNSSALQMGPAGYSPGGRATYPSSSVKWNCRGYNTLSFTLTHYISSNCEAKNLQVYVKSKSGSTIATLVNYAYDYSATIACNIDLSSLSDDQKSEMYLSAYMYAYCGDWTNKWATLYCVATNVIAS